MKIEWLATNVTPVRSSERADHGILGMTLGVFWPVQAAFVVGEPLCDVEITS